MCAGDGSWIPGKSSLLTTELSPDPALSLKWKSHELDKELIGRVSGRLVGLKVLEMTRNELKILNYLLKGQCIILNCFLVVSFIFLQCWELDLGPHPWKASTLPWANFQPLTYFGDWFQWNFFVSNNTPKMPNESIFVYTIPFLNITFY